MRRGMTTFPIACCLLAVCLGASAGEASAKVPDAELLPGGRAVAPASAPLAVKAMIEAGNRIRNRPYRWGGGHRSWDSRGCDCSGSVSYVMHAASLRWDTSMTTEGDGHGPGWSEEMRSTDGFRLRHPLGLLRAG